MKRDKIFIFTKTLEHDGHSLILVGKVLQKIYLDELPQLFCIFKGDISVVGPRPVNLEVYKKELARNNYTKTVIKTGLTGLYQSHKGEVGYTQLELDEKYIYYCANNSSWKIMWLDISITLRTLRVLFRAKGI